MSEGPRTILVTGTTRGIGFELARHFLARGDRVFGCARGEPALEDERYTHVQVDLSDDADVDGMFRSIRQQTPTLDALVNNAGAASMNPVALTPPRSARQIVDLNFLGMFRCTHAAIRLLRRSTAGRIVNLTSVAVPYRLEGEAVYAASKSAVETFTRVLAREVAGFGITCNAVGPGPLKTGLTRGVPAPLLEALVKRQAIRRYTEPADVANVVEFFLSPDSALVTGQVVYLGGAG